MILVVNDILKRRVQPHAATTRVYTYIYIYIIYFYTLQARYFMMFDYTIVGYVGDVGCFQSLKDHLQSVHFVDSKMR